MSVAPVTVVDWIAQAVITVVSGLAMIFVSSPVRRTRRIGFILGLSAQPLWYFVQIYHGQFILLFITTIYTVSWIRGIISNRKRT